MASRTPRGATRLYKKKQLTDRPWSVGDNVNLAVGQGDLPVTPLQLAVAYAAVVNGGYVVRPHLGQRIEDADGRALQEFETPSRRKVDIDPAYRQAILDGLHGAANLPGGTSTDVFAGFKIPVAGKTGTAEKGGAGPTSPGTLRSLPGRPAVRGRGDRRGRRLRRRARRPDGAADHRRSCTTPRTTGTSCRAVGGGPSDRWRNRRSPAVEGVPRGQRAAASCASTRCCWSPRSGLWPARLHGRHGHRGRHRGRPNYYVLRQSIYGAWGSYSCCSRPVRLFAAARAEARALRLDDRLDPARFPARGGRRAAPPLIELAFFRFQPSELGKVLLVLALSAFVSTGSDGCRIARRPAGDAAGTHPGDHGGRAAGPRVRACVPRDRHSRSCLSRGPRGRISRHSGMAVTARGGAAGGSGGRRDRAQGLPGGPSDGVPQSLNEP